jgi:prepilin-type processing-associated H-X9-DG protein
MSGAICSKKKARMAGVTFADGHVSKVVEESSLFANIDAE